MNPTTLPRHLVWSTDTLDLSDPFQRTWYLRQVLMHGRAEDIRALDLDEVARRLDDLDLPPAIYDLWRCFLEMRHATR
jgi:DNA topoisomerase IB